MRSLMVLLDEAAPSFCFYDPRREGPGRRMNRETFERAIAFADSHGLALQLVCGRQGVDGFVDELTMDRPHTRYLPLGSAQPTGDDVLVVDGPRWEADAFPPERHPVCVLRVGRDDLADLPEAWERLAKQAYRVVLVVRDLDGYDEADLARYEDVLVDIRQRLAAKYLRGEAIELSALSDRLALDAPNECGAGVDHLTVAPSGDLHVCPGFAVDGAPPVGDLSSGWSIPNGELLERSKAPICSRCDAHHCRRCVYVNRRATLEVNTPPWQVCRAAHAERESSRVMLASLQERRCLEGLPPIPPLDYVDPLDKLMQVRHGIPRGVAATPRAPLRTPDPPGPAPTAPLRCETSSPCVGWVGRVTPKERDEIQKLYRRKVALTTLLSALASMDAATLESSPIYERFVRDMGETTTAYNDWWERMSTRYSFRRERSDQGWHVDFATCDVLLD